MIDAPNDLLCALVVLAVLYVVALAIHNLRYSQFRGRYLDDYTKFPQTEYRFWYVLWVMFFAASTLAGYLTFYCWKAGAPTAGGPLMSTRYIGLFATSLAFALNVYLFTLRQPRHDLRAHTFTYATFRMFVAIGAAVFIGAFQTHLGPTWATWDLAPLGIVLLVVLAPSQTVKAGYYWCNKRLGRISEAIRTPKGRPRSLLSLNMDPLDVIRFEEEAILDVHGLGWDNPEIVFRNTRYSIQALIAWMIEACDKRRLDLEDQARKRTSAQTRGTHTELIHALRERKAVLIAVLLSLGVGALRTEKDLLGLLATARRSANENRAKVRKSFLEKDDEQPAAEIILDGMREQSPPSNQDEPKEPA